MKRLIQLPRMAEINPMPVMKCVFDEFTAAFKDYGCDIRVVTKVEDLEDGGIAFLDDARGEYINNKEIYYQIGKKCPNTIFVCWYWTDLTFQPFNYMLYTGEHYMFLDEAERDRVKYYLMDRFIPLKFRANDSPYRIGTYERKVVRDYCFMGGGYKMDWIPSDEFTGIYHRVIWDNYLSYDQRREIYLSTMFSLAFQADWNIRVGQLSQRVFEGIAYGCVTFCENKVASDFTDGVIIHITSKQDLENKMRFYKAHPELVLEKQRQGYEWSKKFGTNRLIALSFLDKIKSVFSKEFDDSEYKDEFINKIKMYDTLLGEVKGNIDVKVFRDSEVIIKGWAFSQTYGVLPVRAKYDGTVKNMEAEDRPDVVDIYKRDNIINCGWKLNAPSNKYIDIQIKLNSEWQTIFCFNTFNNSSFKVENTEDKPALKEDAVKPALKEDAVKPALKEEVKPALKEEVKPALKEEVKPALKEEVKPALKEEVKPALKEEVKPALKEEVKPDNSKNNNVIIVDHSINKTILPISMVFDNFYNFPDDVRKMGLNALENDILNKKYKSSFKFKDRFEKLIGHNISNIDSSSGSFSYSLAGDNIKFNISPNKYYGIVFLTPNAPLQTGVTLYRSKNTNKSTVSDTEFNEVFKNGHLDSTEFEPIDIIGNVYNRLVIFNTNHIYARTNNFGNNIENCRLIQTFIFEIEK